MRAALQILLDGKCYHGVEIFNASPEDPDYEIWKKALQDGNISKDDLHTLFDARGFRAGADVPLALFYRCVLQLKFLLFPHFMAIFLMSGVVPGMSWQLTQISK